jgi:hypothetical protein
MSAEHGGCYPGPWRLMRAFYAGCRDWIRGSVTMDPCSTGALLTDGGRPEDRWQSEEVPFAGRSKFSLKRYAAHNQAFH